MSESGVNHGLVLLAVLLAGLTGIVAGADESVTPPTLPTAPVFPQRPLPEMPDIGSRPESAPVFPVPPMPQPVIERPTAGVQAPQSVPRAGSPGIDLPDQPLMPTFSRPIVPMAPEPPENAESDTGDDRVADPAEGRLLRFPTGESSGRVFARKTDEDGGSAWRLVGGAAGDILLPASDDIALEVTRPLDRETRRRLVRSPQNVLAALKWRVSSVRDEDWRVLEHLTDLRYLDLSGTNVSDADLVRLGAMDGLRVLLLLNTKVTDEGVNRLLQSLSQCDIQYGEQADYEKDLESREAPFGDVPTPGHHRESL